MKGIVLAGGKGTRLWPTTRVISKQLLSVYDKPMIFYPVSTLMEAGIKEIAIISDPVSLPIYEKLLSSGLYGVNFTYIEQPEPKGIAEAFILAENFLQNESVTLILGDNIFINVQNELRGIYTNINWAWCYSLPVGNASRYGVVELDQHNKVLSIEEKPKKPKSNLALLGAYSFGPGVSDKAKKLKPSRRGELEITDLLKMYLKEKHLQVIPLDNRVTWLDSGTQESLLDISTYVKTTQERTGKLIACLEEIALNNNWITKEQLKQNLDNIPECPYKDYLKRLVN